MAFVPGRRSCLGVMPLRRFFWCNAVASYQRSGGRPLFVAQLDLKKAFDKAKHSAISDALLSKGVSPHHVAILNSLGHRVPCCSSLVICGQLVLSKLTVEFLRGLPNPVGVHDACG